MTLNNPLLAIISSAALAMPGARAGAQIYVSPSGDFDPAGWSPSSAFGTFSGAFRKADHAGQTAIRVTSGSYPGAITISRPGRIEAAGGVAIIGSPHVASTPFNVVCYNTHLFGSGFLQPYWRDGDYDPANETPGRAAMFGVILGNPSLHLVPNEIDLVALDEVWDSGFLNTLTSRYLSGGGNYFHGDGKFSPSGQPYLLNSGLLAMSKHGIQNGTRDYFPYSTMWGDDSTAGKGVVSGEITKAGMTVGFFLTHTQAETTSGNAGGDDDNDGVLNGAEGRRQQIEIVAAMMDSYLTANPGNAAIVLGDLNVIGDDVSDADTDFVHLRNTFRLIGGRDSARNLLAHEDMTAANRPFDTYRSQENNLAFGFQGGAPHYSQRLDYIIYANSRNGKVRLIPEEHRRLEWKFPGGPYTNPLWVGGGAASSNVTSSHLSDHFGLLSRFRLVTLP